MQKTAGKSIFFGIKPRFVPLFLLVSFFNIPGIVLSAPPSQKDAEVFILAKSVKLSKKIPKIKEKYTWNIESIGAKNAQKKTSGKSVKVALLDTGIDINHTDLKDNIRGGINIIDPSSDFNDDNGHGSHVAGIIAATRNKAGIVGAAPQVEIFAVKVIGKDGIGRVSDVVKGIDWAIENNMQVLNMSFGTEAYSSQLETAVQKAIDSGITVVAAAGNTGEKGNQLLYPAKFKGVISVFATDRKNRPASWSCHDSGATLAAPGNQIFSAYKDGGYAALDGTSAAAPHVTASVALILTQPVKKYDLNKDGLWNPDELREKLVSSADQITKNSFAFKKVNAKRAIK